MRAVGQALPITHAAEAARRLAGGEGFAAAVPALAAETAVGLGYAVLAAALLKLFEAESRRHASLDTLSAAGAGRHPPARPIVGQRVGRDRRRAAP